MPSRMVAFGSNGSGQLGIGHQRDTYVPTDCILPTPSTPDETVRYFAAGGNHTLVRTSERRVYAAGNNEGGRCGLPTETAGMCDFRLVELREKDSDKLAEITHVAATWEASFFVIGCKRVYACGRGGKGELGAGEGRVLLETPELIFDADESLGGMGLGEIRASVNHVVIVTWDGRLVGWGSSRKGQLGEELSAAKVVWSPTEIRMSQFADHVVVGRNFTLAAPVLAEPLIGLGDTQNLGDVFKRYNPATLTSLHSSWSNVYIEQNHDEVIGFGRSKFNQVPSKALPRLWRFAAGSEHCIGKTLDQEIIAWGWDEHGNCGVAVSGDDLWNTVDIEQADDEYVSNLGAGCATSFVVFDSRS